jgi:hypothetical protein
MLEPNFTEDQIKLLNTPPKPDEIEKKQGLSYLKGQAAIVKANRIFGIGNWSYKQVGPIEITDTGVNNSKSNRIYLVSATVELTVRGCETFVEQGDCEAQGMGAPSISMARKGAVTDGVKRCLKNFGPAFGLNLYFDHPEQASSEPTSTPAPNHQQPATAPTSRPVTPQAPRPVNPMPPAQIAPRTPQAQPVTPSPIPAPSSGELATEQQRTAIVNMAGRKGVDDIELNDRLTQLYGVELKALTRNDAAHFIKVFQGQVK